MLIRKYVSSDRSSVERIQFETYFLGKSGSLLVTSRKRFNEDIRYYLEKEPESCYVAEDKGKVVGYLLGCLDDKNNDESISAFFVKSVGRLFALPFMDTKDRKFYWSSFKMMFNAIIGKSEEMKFIPPKDSGHIHINLLPQARGKGAGSKLLKAFFNYAKSKGVKRIHADSFQTRLNPNKNFWIRNGFKEYINIKTIVWKEYYPKEDIRLVCYVKEL